MKSIFARKLLATASAVFFTGVLLASAMAQEQAPEENAPYGIPISADFPFEKKSASVMDHKMTYVDEGEGPVVLFLHGNPTSSYLWRNIIPHVTAAGYRAVAPDLIGMGDSDKPDIGYTFDEHAAYLDGFIAEAGLKDITLVIHDWGSALGMRYARLNPDNVRGVAFMEAIIPPAFPAASLEAMGPNGDMFRSLRTEGVGEEMILDQNFFVEEVLAKLGVARGLTEDEMVHYRAPYATRESRLPTLQWPREIPIGGEPKAATEAVIANGEWLMENDIPKLYFYASPGAINSPQVLDYLVANVSNLETRFVGRGTHFLQEDHPDLIGSGVVDWLRRTGPK